MFYNVFAPFSSLRFGSEAIGLDDAQVMRHIREDKNAVLMAGMWITFYRSQEGEKRQIIT